MTRDDLEAAMALAKETENTLRTYRDLTGVSLAQAVYDLGKSNHVGDCGCILYCRP